MRSQADRRNLDEGAPSSTSIRRRYKKRNLETTFAAVLSLMASKRKKVDVARDFDIAESTLRGWEKEWRCLISTQEEKTNRLPSDLWELMEFCGVMLTCDSTVNKSRWLAAYMKINHHILSTYSAK